MIGKVFRVFLLVACLAGLVSCGGGGSRDSRFKPYYGPAVTWIIVQKQQRRMYLFHGNKVLKEYKIGLGFAPYGHKQFEGDGRTPEGIYMIDRQNPNSDFHLSIGVSYPNVRDVAFAQAYGRSPGGNIFIHGEPNNPRNRMSKGPDWTAGCISVTNEEIEEIYSMVRPGTPIAIQP